jgi:hypothetical protein
MSALNQPVLAKDDLCPDQICGNGEETLADPN